MSLVRSLMPSLREWAVQSRRRPLLLLGARQTGKTRLVEILGREGFEYTATFSLASEPALRRLLASPQDPHALLQALQRRCNVPILPGKTLIVFDNMETGGHAVERLSGFARRLPEYAVAAVGTYLSTETNDGISSDPDGLVDIREVGPLSFAEFLQNASPELFDFVEGISDLAPLPAVRLRALEEVFLSYLCIGGMPEAVCAFLEGADWSRVDAILRDVRILILGDCAMHAAPRETRRLIELWNAIPQALCRSNTRFFLRQIHPNARSREFAPAIEWLCRAGLVRKVHRVSGAEWPLGEHIEPDIFKLFALDVGLLRITVNLCAKDFLHPFVRPDFRRAAALNHTASTLFRTFGRDPYFWSSDAKAEIDLLAASHGRVFPIEVKAGRRVAGKSLSVFAHKFSPPLCIRLTDNTLKKEANVLHVPLALVDWLPKFIDLALPNQIEEAADNLQ